MKTSTQLSGGQVYIRSSLAKQVGTKDVTIKTGVFRPAGHESVWLFVTEDKPADRT
jgi:hypothetical protein